MSYVHRWHVLDLNAVRRALPAVARDLCELLPRLPPLAGAFGQGPPELGPDRLLFNGPRPENADTFVLSGDRGDYAHGPGGLAGRCATRSLRYDRAVCAALALLHRAAPGALRLASTATYAEWRAALGPLGLAGGLGGLLGRELWRVATADGEVVAEAAAGAEPGQSLPAFLGELSARGLLPLEGPFVPLEPVAELAEGWVPLRAGAFVYVRPRGPGGRAG